MGKSELENDEITDEEETSEEQESSESDELFEDMDIPQGLEDTRKEMQRAFTRKTTQLAEERKQYEREIESLKQKADMYDRLASDPEQAIKILSSMSGKSDKSRANFPDDDDDFSDFGDNAETMKRLVSSITKKVTGSIQQQMSPIFQNFQETAVEREMKSLSSWVESQRKKTGLDLPDPYIFEPSITDRMNRKGDTAIEAYKASINLDRLQTRPPVEKKKKPGSFQPGTAGAGKSSVGKKKFTPDDMIELKRQGKKAPTITELEEMYEKGEL